ncbi:MAG: VCBS repeat-containing protein [Desulfuromonadaceae bacterium]
MILRPVVFLVFLCCLLLGTTVAQASVDAIARDFKPLPGVVIMPVQNEFLIDQDASNGVVAGDLFSVIQPGANIIHPVTNEVLGSLDEVKGLLVVTRVRSGYSYAKPVGSVQGIERGDQIRRYTDLTATLWDYTDRGEAFFAQLKAALPNLDWQDYAVAQAARPSSPAPPAGAVPGLVFILKNDGLDVRGSGFQTVRAYPSPIAAVRPVPAPAPVVPAVTVPAPAPVAAARPAPASANVDLERRMRALELAMQQNQTSAPSAPSAAPYRLEKPRQGSLGAPVYEVAYSGFGNVGALPGCTLMADFIQEGGRLLMAATNGKGFEVFAVGETLTPLAQGDTTSPSRVLALHWWQPEASGPLYLTATLAVDENTAFSAVSGKKIGSAIFEFTGNALVPVREGLPYLLGTFDRNGDGSREVLLGQEFDRDIFFGTRIYELRLKNGEIERDKPSFDIPRSFPVQGSLFADLTGDGKAETIYVKNRTLFIYDGRKKLYESAQTIGGSLSVMTYAINPGAADQLTSSAAFEVAPVAADLDGDGQLELVAFAADGSSFRAPGIGPGIDRSWLQVLKFSDGGFVRGTMGGELEAPLQGLTVSGSRVLLVASAPSDLFEETRGSQLLALPLAMGGQ